ncbi:UDP-N-acetylglucosamine pyrophosphorylase [Desulfobacter latus]|uniref:UDP-N-acetylglucosamine pyrophosphorylase n=1 Tax=Desulfobacter latus TaxID=2292 RepID=A0A850T9S6_9BACT|nr:UDP-N-acetylglucosamine pyrophosphorylase [Desulfobacter latus]NWH06332.1 UDP-N-acetylglucosamine pyrophosphorylase [Desulfobacter latus]
MNHQDNQQRIQRLLDKGVRIMNPHSVEIGAEVDLERISGSNVTIHSGCKILGATTLILDGARLGYEAPVTIQDCQIGPDVDLKGGYFKSAVFLEKANMGSGAQIREGCIFEEEANGAHTVGLKQTILFPFVTLGSLINFCDCFMAGGTSRKDHSEVGSSYIHFNYTPNQDKATPSLIGDVPQGVMLDQRPIFLGGQGGMVGPCRLSYGTMVTAGTVLTKDELRPNRLIHGNLGRKVNIRFVPGRYGDLSRIIRNNMYYIANLYALRQWYRQVRVEFIGSRFPKSLHEALLDKLELAVAERIKRLDLLSRKLISLGKKRIKKASSPAKKLSPNQEFAANWDQVADVLQHLSTFQGDSALQDRFLFAISEVRSQVANDYLSAIQNLDAENKNAGTQWLTDIVNEVLKRTSGCLPGLNIVDNPAT